jgi:hypothetical protein
MKSLRDKIHDPFQCSEIKRVTSSDNPSTDAQTARAKDAARKRDVRAALCPDDDAIIDYVLGVADEKACRIIETWLVIHPSHADQLASVAESVLAIAGASDRLRPAASAARLSIRTPRDVRLRYAAWFSIAASIVVLCCLAGQSTKDHLSQASVAMAWAEASAPEIPDSPEWLFESAPFEGIVVDDSSDRTQETAMDNEFQDSGADVGFSSSAGEPPEWLVTAVIAMDASRPLESIREVSE